MPECELCRLARGLDRVTRCYFEDSRVVVVDCRTCLVELRKKGVKDPRAPMIVLKRHGARVVRADTAYITRVAARVFPGSDLRFKMRSIKDHFHCHVCCCGFFSLLASFKSLRTSTASS